MKLGFLADPLDSFKIWKDSTYVMMSEAVRRGHDIYAFEQKDMAMRDGHVTAVVSRITLIKDPDKSWYEIEERSELPLNELSAIIVRKDPPFDTEYLYATYLLERAEWEGTRVFNRPEAIRRHNEKLAITQFPEFIVPTLVCSDEKRIREFHAEHGDIILKPLNAMGGAGVFHIQKEGLNFGAVVEMLTGNGSITIMAQRYIPEIAGGDKRVLLIDGEVIPYSLARLPQAGEIRANLAVGGIGVAQPLSTRDREIAETLAPLLAIQGLFLVGLDIIGDWLTEVNVTSPTCFREIMEQTGYDVAALFIDKLENSLTISMK